MKLLHCICFTLLLARCCATNANADDLHAKEPVTAPAEYGLTIRSTPHRSPAEEQAGFHLPVGFAIDLIASEPTIKKPLNLAFDRKGRLWVTQTTHYPFPAKEGDKRTDSIAVLEDRDGNGSFETHSVFAEDLNIPIGILPTDDGAICFSIPNIWKLRDTDGDGKCDERSILFGPFDTSRDTHGMVNSLRDGNDGWIYACHGFNNQSTVSGTDGHSVSMTSGNVFRFRPDGSRIELYTQGQVNPFGMTQDEWGNWFSADCHSKPITQLIRGGCYPSFGRPDDGLGFVPATMDHLHGSTAIAGLAHTKDSSFPRSMRGQLVSGNVMTCRINRNQLQYSGATAQAIELPDLLTSEDSWFRPVDLVFGPDGHLYVADFYNKVIGHYEVPLDHPDRDRTSGRLWRIRSTELANRIERISTAVDVSADSSLNKPLAELDLTHTSTAMRWLKTIESIADNPDIGSLRSMLPLVEKVEQSKDPILMQSFLIALRKCILGAMEKDSNATSSLLRSTNAPESTFSAPRYAIMLKVLLATKDSRCHSVALDLLDRKLSSLKNGSPQERTEWGQAMEKLIGVADDQNVERLLDLLHRDDSLTADKPSLYANRLLTLLQRQLQSRGKLSPPVVSAARNTMEFLASDWLHRFEKNHSVVLDWMATTPGKRDDRKDWPIEPRKRRLPGEQETSPLDIYSSFPLGESYQGSWGTAPMLAPEKWSFYIAGHNGLPNMPDHQKNFARLISLDLRSGETKELFRAYPPRNDVAKWVEWELKEYAGQPVLFEVVDGDAGSSYAWLGVGGFSADALAMDVRRSDYALIQSFVSLIGLEDAKHSPALWKWASSPILSESCKLRIWKKSWLENQPIDTEILSYAMETQQWDLARRFFWETPDAKDLHFSEAFSVWKQQYRQLFRRWSASQQTKIIHRISKYRGAPERLAEWIESSLLSPDVVSTLPPSWWGGLSKSESDRLATIKTLAEKSANRSDRIESKLASIKRETVDLEIGKKMYADKCAQCHKLGSVGNVLGPQLEGIGNRGLERLCEDILWPDRNVDEAFRVTLLLLDGGETVTGLVQERNDASITIAEQNGTKRVIPIMDIEQEKKGEVSLMPSNFDEVLTTKELACLLEFLRTEVSKNKGN